jgi:hypothetical protein
MKASFTSVSHLRDHLGAQHTAREERRRLERELASYDSPSDRLELDAIIARHEPDEVAELADIIARQSVGRTRRQHVGRLAG